MLVFFVRCDKEPLVGMRRLSQEEGAYVLQKKLAFGRLASYNGEILRKGCEFMSDLEKIKLVKPPFPFKGCFSLNE